MMGSATPAYPEAKLGNTGREVKEAYIEGLWPMRKPYVGDKA